MAIRVGIGIITCNRKDVLAETLARLRAHTTSPCTLAVADDGSTDGTEDLGQSTNEPAEGSVEAAPEEGAETPSQEAAEAPGADEGVSSNEPAEGAVEDAPAEGAEKAEQAE